MSKEVIMEPKEIYKFETENGNFKRQISSFRDFISDAPGARFPPKKGRYVDILSFIFPPSNFEFD
jgi:glutathionyl-hydroquinone reductase